MTPLDAIAPDVYPTVARYLEALPRGLASYPECVNKASLLRSALDVHPLHGARPSALPSALLELIRRPPLVSTWIPAVHDLAIKLVIFDAHFGSIDAFERFAYDAQLALFDGPLYRFSMRRLGPQRLLRRVPTRWRHFHRGTTLTLERVEPGRAALLHDAPAGLYGEVAFAGLSA
ncbi:MAG: hypothetical protein KC468_28180, partial [Myxococcales bacterium]|nr:hypothetical protein [Myxococcales bacterium]